MIVGRTTCAGRRPATGDRMQISYDYNGKTALVTGAGTGIGFAVSRELAATGATVTVMGHMEDQVRPAVEKLQAEFGKDRSRAAVRDVAVETDLSAAAKVARDCA